MPPAGQQQQLLATGLSTSNQASSAAALPTTPGQLSRCTRRPSSIRTAPVPLFICSQHHRICCCRAAAAVCRLFAAALLHVRRSSSSSSSPGPSSFAASRRQPISRQAVAIFQPAVLPTAATTTSALAAAAAAAATLMQPLCCHLLIFICRLSPHRWLHHCRLPAFIVRHRVAAARPPLTIHSASYSSYPSIYLSRLPLSITRSIPTSFQTPSCITHCSTIAIPFNYHHRPFVIIVAPSPIAIAHHIHRLSSSSPIIVVDTCICTRRTVTSPHCCRRCAPALHCTVTSTTSPTTTFAAAHYHYHHRRYHHYPLHSPTLHLAPPPPPFHRDITSIRQRRITNHIFYCIALQQQHCCQRNIATNCTATCTAAGTANLTLTLLLFI